MVDAVVTGNRVRAFGLLEDMLKNGEERLGILAMLLRQYRLMQHVKIMQYEKMNQQEILAKLGMKGYPGNMLLRQTARQNAKQVRMAVDICLNT